MKAAPRTPCQEQPGLFTADEQAHIAPMAERAVDLCETACRRLAECERWLAERIAAGDAPQSAVQAGQAFDRHSRRFDPTTGLPAEAAPDPERLPRRGDPKVYAAVERLAREERLADREIAARLGVDPATVCRVRIALGVPSGSTATNADIRAKVRELAAAGLSDRQIAEALGGAATAELVRAVRRRHNIPAGRHVRPDITRKATA